MNNYQNDYLNDARKVKSITFNKYLIIQGNVVFQKLTYAVNHLQ